MKKIILFTLAISMTLCGLTSKVLASDKITSFEEKLNQFRFSLNNDLIIGRDGFKMRDGFNFDKKHPALIRVKDFLTDNHKEIIAYQENILGQYVNRSDVRQDLNKYSPLNLKLDNFYKEINKKLSKAPFYRLLMLDPRQVIQRLRYDIVMTMKVLGTPLSETDNAQFFYRRKLPLTGALIQTKKLDNNQWEITANDYDFIYILTYDVAQAKIIHLEVLERKDKGLLILEISYSTDKVKIYINNELKGTTSTDKNGKHFFEIELVEGEYQIYGIAGTANPMWIQNYYNKDKPKKISVKGREVNIEFLSSTGLTINPKFPKKQLARIKQLMAISDTYATNPARKADFLGKDNGTVIDKRSGLQWQRCSVGQKWTGTTCEGTPVELSLKDAKNYSKNYAGYADWRMPSIYELETLLYCHKHKQFPRSEVQGEWLGSSCEEENHKMAIVQEVFPNTGKNYYWTSTQSADGQYTYTKEFSMGGVGGTAINGKSDCKSCYHSNLRLVRDADALNNN